MFQDFAVEMRLREPRFSDREFLSRHRNFHASKEAGYSNKRYKTI